MKNSNICQNSATAKDLTWILSMSYFPVIHPPTPSLAWQCLVHTKNSVWINIFQQMLYSEIIILTRDNWKGLSRQNCVSFLVTNITVMGILMFPIVQLYNARLYKSCAVQINGFELNIWQIFTKTGDLRIKVKSMFYNVWLRQTDWVKCQTKIEGTLT